MQVDETSIRAGITLVRWFANEARRVYAMLSADEETNDAIDTAERIRRKGGSVSVRDWQRSRSHSTSDDAEAELEDLVRRRLGYWHPVPPGERGGRPTRVFVLSDSSDTDRTS